jgi:hypothetical protein
MGHTEDAKMKLSTNTTTRIALLAAFPLLSALAGGGTAWTLDSTDDWKQAAGKTGQVKLDEGRVVPQADAASFESTLHRFDQKRRATTLTLVQQPQWNTWRPTPKRLDPDQGRRPILSLRRLRRPRPLDAVEARVGVDTDHDGKTDRWTGWQAVRETYAQKPGFARVVSKTPAQLDLRDLPAGFGFQIAFRTKTQDGHRPVITKAELGFE